MRFNADIYNKVFPRTEEKEKVEEKDATVEGFTEEDNTIEEGEVD